MAISNKFGPMVVTTGNKSEMSVGYATLYGDMCGGYNPVLRTSTRPRSTGSPRWRNRWKPDGALGPDGVVIPENIITKAPTAELRENQKDQDSLPPYDVLDAILEGLVEREMRVCEIVARGHDLETVKKIERLLYLAEYKRRQAAPGVKVTRKNFGRDRRYPIVNRFRDQGQVAFRPDEALQQGAGKGAGAAVDLGGASAAAMDAGHSESVALCLPQVPIMEFRGDPPARTNRAGKIRVTNMHFRVIGRNARAFAAERYVA